MREGHTSHGNVEVPSLNVPTEVSMSVTWWASAMLAAGELDRVRQAAKAVGDARVADRRPAGPTIPQRTMLAGTGGEGLGSWGEISAGMDRWQGMCCRTWLLSVGR